MDLTTEQFRWILIYIFVLVISVALHEFGHAIMAHKLGDDTPSRQGRVTLNPLAHADPISTFMLPLVSSLVTGGAGGFGWGKPVEWQPHRVSRRISMSAARILVSVAGPGMNLVLGTVIACVHMLLVSLHVLDLNSQISAILHFAVRLNFVLFFFNLLPLPPLDGGNVVSSLVPYRHREAFDNIARYAPFALLAIICIPQIGGIFGWPADVLTAHLYTLLGLPA